MSRSDADGNSLMSIDAHKRGFHFTICILSCLDFKCAELQNAINFINTLSSRNNAAMVQVHMIKYHDFLDESIIIQVSTMGSKVKLLIVKTVGIISLANDMQSSARRSDQLRLVKIGRRNESSPDVSTEQ